MSDTLYPMFYGTRLVTFDVLEATFSPKCHPEFWRRMKNFLLHQGGKFGIGGGWRAVGAQPDLSGFAPEGKSFHQSQLFKSGLYFAAFDLVVVNPGHVHRAPTWSEVPVQGKKFAYDYGIHANVGVPGARGSESWHHQPVELDGWDTWVAKGRPDIDCSYPIAILAPRPTPPQPPVPENPVITKEITVEIKSRNLVEGCVGPDVKFFQLQLNNVAGQGLLLDGYYGPRMKEAVMNFQRFFKLTVDGNLGPKTQAAIIEVALQAS